MEIPENMLAQIEKALCSALDRFKHTIREVDINLIDLNGPKGGLDKRCNVQIRFEHQGSLVVTSTGASIIQIVHEACDKLRHVITKRLSKAKSKRHLRHMRTLNYDMA